MPTETVRFVIDPADPEQLDFLRSEEFGMPQLPLVAGYGDGDDEDEDEEGGRAPKLPSLPPPPPTVAWLRECGCTGMEIEASHYIAVRMSTPSRSSPHLATLCRLPLCALKRCPSSPGAGRAPGGRRGTGSRPWQRWLAPGVAVSPPSEHTHAQACAQTHAHTIPADSIRQPGEVWRRVDDLRGHLTPKVVHSSPDLPRPGQTS